MPTGWTTTADKTAVSLGQNGCLKTAARRGETKTSRYLTFAGAGGAPIFSESVALFPSTTVAANFADAVKALDACKKISIKAGTVTLIGGLTPTSSPTLGMGSRAYTLQASAGAHVLTQYVLIARTARVVVLTSYATLSATPAVSDFLSLSTKAVSKVS